MFQLKSLPRSLDAALRDVQHNKARIRQSALDDLARCASVAGTDERATATSAIAKVLRTDPDSAVRAHAAVALADADASEQLDALLEAMEDAEPQVRQMALLALGEVAPAEEPRVQALVERHLCAGPAPLRFQALLAAQRLAVDALPAKLEAATRDVDPSIRYLALRLLDQVYGDVEAPAKVVERAENALTDPDHLVATAAAMFAAPRGVDEARELLVEAIDRGAKLSAPEDEQAIVEMAGELGLRGAMAGLRRIAWGRFGLVPGRFSWQAKVALAQLGDPTARNEIQKGLASKDPTVVHLAVVAVGRAGWKELASKLPPLADKGLVSSETVDEALRLLGDSRASVRATSQ